MKTLKTFALSTTVALLVTHAAHADSNLPDNYRLKIDRNHASLSRQPEWVNPYMPHATGNAESLIIDEQAFSETLAKAYKRATEYAGWKNGIASTEPEAPISGDMLLEAIVQGYGTGYPAEMFDGGLDLFPAGATASGN